VGTLSIRDAVWDDVGKLADLFVRSSLSNEDDRHNLLKNPSTLEYSDLGVRERRTRVVTTRGHIIGFATTLVFGDVLELVDLFVDPEWMGRGLGRSLVLDVVAVARQHGIPRVEVTGNNRARGFYAKVGFVFDYEVEMQFAWASRMHLDVSLPR
jgi:N-acetylglutamate synthase-like GNAT family acetyltransferase